MDGVATSIIERPRPLPQHDTPNPTHHTLNSEEPLDYDNRVRQCIEMPNHFSISSACIIDSYLFATPGFIQPYIKAFAHAFIFQIHLMGD